MSIKWSTATILKIAAVAIAAPRFAGAFGSAIGLDVLEHYPWLADFEVASGGAMALLEGFAIAFVLGRWRVLKPATVHWYTLLVFIVALASTLPGVAVPYLLAEQGNYAISEVFTGLYWLQIGWSFLVAGVPMLIIMAVGFADASEVDRAISEVADKQKIKAAKLDGKQQAAKKQAKPKQVGSYICKHCGASFDSSKARGGHLAHCKAKQNGKVEAEQEIDKS